MKKLNGNEDFIIGPVLIGDPAYIFATWSFERILHMHKQLGGDIQYEF